MNITWLLAKRGDGSVVADGVTPDAAERISQVLTTAGVTVEVLPADSSVPVIVMTTED